MWDEYCEKVKELYDHADEMNGKDNSFIESVATYEEDGRIFSTPQRAWIDDLYQKFCT